MKALFAAVLMLGCTAFAFADTDVSPDVPQITAPQALPIWYPQAETEIRFKVLRKGRRFGTHIIQFEPLETGGFTATNDIDFLAKFGPITLYSYRHDSVETWEDGRLVNLEAETRKEGGTLTATAVADETGLVVTGSNFSGTYRSDIIPASHWNIAQLFSGKMLSTEGGQLLDAKVETLGRETLIVNGQSIEATKFRLDSDLTAFLWYDDQGRWLKLSLTARGQKIEYVLQDLY